MRLTKRYIDEHIKAYKQCASLVLVDNTLQIINRQTKCNHLFVGSEEKIILSKVDLIKVKEWIK
jgi:hypothetical protein